LSIDNIASIVTRILVGRKKQLEKESVGRQHRTGAKYFPSTVQVGIGLISVGTLSLVASYLVSSTILTFIGLGLVLWGIVLFYVSQTALIPQEMALAVPLSMTNSLGALVSGTGHKGKVIFLHPKDFAGINQGYVFVAREKTSDLALPSDAQIIERRLFYENPAGMLFTAPSQSVVDLFEKKLNVNFGIVDMAYVEQRLPSLLVEELNVAESVSIETHGDTTKLTIKDRSSATLCRDISSSIEIGKQLGCPLCSSLALVLSKVAGKPVAIVESMINKDTIHTTYKQV
jgi:hypothetical protein